jgi:hypothetical protein
MADRKQRTNAKTERPAAPGGGATGLQPGGTIPGGGPGAGVGSLGTGGGSSGGTSTGGPKTTPLRGPGGRKSQLA